MTGSSSQRRRRVDYGFSRTVSYNSSNHVSVILQCFGSVWRQVLPYCIFNVSLTAFLLYLLSRGIDWTVSEWGHEFMSVMVSFLVITKFNLTLSVYYEMQKNLMLIGSSARQIVMLACSLTAKQPTRAAASLSHQQQEVWRSDVAYYAMLMVSTTATMLTKTNDLNAWQAPGMSEEVLGQMHLKMERTTLLQEPAQEANHHTDSRHYEYGHNLPSDLNLRVPIRMAHKLQTIIGSSPLLDSIQTKQLMDQVENFLTGFHGIRVYLNIPLPFSMVQMARIFLFLYIFTMPFAILSADLGLQDFHVLFLVFIMTYGFMGMEIVCMNLDDPFGNDPTDLPVIEQANELFEDVYLMIWQSDGFSAAAQLRDKMESQQSTKVPSENDPLLPKT